MSINDFSHECECHYRGERYSARDNGAVQRHPHEGRKPRPTDLVWTFGKPNQKLGYLEIAAVRVHRIVATAFHGEPPTPEHVVDHIDTNRHNNRPENLRWLTRLENVLKNPITVKRIELICGSVEAFLANPALLRGSDIDPNFAWMRVVSIEEARACRERMEAWAKTDKVPNGSSIGEWVFQPISEKPSPKRAKATVPTRTMADSAYKPNFVPLTEVLPQLLPLVMARTPETAAQRKWNTPSDFPCCPLHGDDLASYAKELAEGLIFCRNHYSESRVVKTALSKDGGSLWVMSSQSEGAVKPWALAQVAYEDGLYVHTNLGTFFHKDGAEKQLCLAQGREWTGGDTFDDYC